MRSGARPGSSSTSSSTAAQIGFDEAVDFLIAQTGFERPAALAEVKRYTCTPTYQLSYLYGRHMIERLQGRRAAQRDGSRFNLKFFHDTLLYGGTMPVSVCPATLRRLACPIDPRRGRPRRGWRCSHWSPAAASPTPSPSLPARPRRRPRSMRRHDPGTRCRATVRSTNKGSFTIELDPRAAPIATANFVALARCGFYDGISFHRILAGFVVQAGDPQTKTNHGDFDGLGSGGPGYGFAIEMPPDGTAYTTYTVAMANEMQYDPAPARSAATDTTAASSSSTLPTCRPPDRLLHVLRQGRRGGPT